MSPAGPVTCLLPLERVTCYPLNVPHVTPPGPVMSPAEPVTCYPLSVAHVTPLRMAHVGPLRVSHVTPCACHMFVTPWACHMLPLERVTCFPPGPVTWPVVLLDFTILFLWL